MKATRVLWALGIFIMVDYLIGHTGNSYTFIFTGWASGSRLLTRTPAHRFTEVYWFPDINMVQYPHKDPC